MQYALLSPNWKVTLLQEWNDASLVVVHKKKGNKTVCCNDRRNGISLLAGAGKILASDPPCKSFLQTGCCHRSYPLEWQTRLWRNSRTTIMCFVARLPQTKCREQKQHLFIIHWLYQNFWHRQQRSCVVNPLKMWQSPQIHCQPKIILYGRVCSHCCWRLGLWALSCESVASLIRTRKYLGFERRNAMWSVNFYRNSKLSKRNVPICSASLGMFCLNFVFSLLAASVMEQASLGDDRCTCQSGCQRSLRSCHFSQPLPSPKAFFSQPLPSSKA